MKRHACVFVPVVAASVAAIGLAAGTALAGISGPCSASLAGANVANQSTGATSSAISVRHDATVPIVMSASGRLSHVRILLEFGGFSWVVKDKVETTPVYRDTIPVKDYATYGVGLYKVKGEATGPGIACSGSALVKVAGNPITTVAGGVGLGAAVLGLAGLIAGALGGIGGIRPFRMGASSLAGLIAAVGILVLLQQAAILYPTALVVAVGLAVGFGLGTLAPWIGKFLGHGAGKGHGITGRLAHPTV